MSQVDELAKILWDFHRLNQRIQKADVVIGLGSYDLRVADRTVEIAQLFAIPCIIFSGAAGNWTKGIWKKTEADIFKERAIELGVPEDKILLENKSTNIGENLRFSKILLAEKGIEVEKIVVVTKPQTERRVLATLPLIWPEVNAIIASPNTTFEDQPTASHSKVDLINEMVGDIQRIKVYPEKGFQISQEIPENVWQAFQELVQLGYTKHLLK